MGGTISIPNTTHHSSQTPLSSFQNLPMPQSTVGSRLGALVGTQVSSVTSQQTVPIAVLVVICQGVTPLERACSSVGTSAQIFGFSLNWRWWYRSQRGGVAFSGAGGDGDADGADGSDVDSGDEDGGGGELVVPNVT